mgnify:CR=1 FL=1
MRFTNELNLPDAIVRAVTNDPYDKGDADFSVTGLIGPVRAKALTVRHDAEIVEDVSERLFSLYGQVGHAILERADTDALPERFYLTREYKGCKIVVSGRGDSLVLSDGGLLDDYKLTRVWSVMDGPKPEWIAQLNLYRLGLIECFGFVVERLRITALIQDWMWRQGGKGKYPDRSVVALPIEVWPLEQTEAYLMERIAAHVDARSIDDADLPECTNDERYCGKTKWAVMIPGRKSAKKLCDILGEAEHMCEGNPTWYIEQRGGQSVRCARYCLAGKQTSFCNQWLRIQEEEAKTPLAESVEADTSAIE